MSETHTRYPVRPLAEVAQFLDHRRRPVKESERTPGPYPYFGANGRQGTINGFIFDEPLVLLAEDGGHFDNPERKIAYQIEGRSWVNNHAHVLRPRDGIDIAYLRRVLENKDVRSFVTGSTRAKLTKAGASRIGIPVPPLSEQRRIAELLDRADELRTTRRQAIGLLGELTRSVFLDMFGDPITNSRGWKIRPLGDVSRVIRGASPRPKGDPRYFGGPIPWLMISDVTRTTSDVVFDIREGVTEAGRDKSVHLRAGTLVLTNSATVGVPKFLGVDACIHDGFLAILDISEDLEPRYLYHFFSLNREHISSLAPMGTQRNLNTGIAKSLRIPVPPRASQRRFAELMRVIDAQRKDQEAHLTELDELFASLQARAFRGDL